jgi:hypothetical protein
MSFGFSKTRHDFCAVWGTPALFSVSGVTISQPPLPPPHPKTHIRQNLAKMLKLIHISYTLLHSGNLKEDVILVVLTSGVVRKASAWQSV